MTFDSIKPHLTFLSTIDPEKNSVEFDANKNLKYIDKRGRISNFFWWLFHFITRKPANQKLDEVTQEILNGLKEVRFISTQDKELAEKAFTKLQKVIENNGGEKLELVITANKINQLPAVQNLNNTANTESNSQTAAATPNFTEEERLYAAKKSLPPHEKSPASNNNNNDIQKTNDAANIQLANPIILNDKEIKQLKDLEDFFKTNPSFPNLMARAKNISENTNKNLRERQLELLVNNFENMECAKTPPRKTLLKYQATIIYLFPRFSVERQSLILAQALKDALILNFDFNELIDIAKEASENVWLMAIEKSFKSESSLFSEIKDGRSEYEICITTLNSWLEFEKINNEHIKDILFHIVNNLILYKKNDAIADIPNQLCALLPQIYYKISYPDVYLMLLVKTSSYASLSTHAITLLDYGRPELFLPAMQYLKFEDGYDQTQIITNWNTILTWYVNDSRDVIQYSKLLPFIINMEKMWQLLEPIFNKNDQRYYPAILGHLENEPWKAFFLYKIMDKLKESKIKAKKVFKTSKESYVTFTNRYNGAKEIRSSLAQLLSFNEEKIIRREAKSIIRLEKAKAEYEKNHLEYTKVDDKLKAYTTAISNLNEWLRNNNGIKSYPICSKIFAQVQLPVKSKNANQVQLPLTSKDWESEILSFLRSVAVNISTFNKFDALDETYQKYFLTSARNLNSKNLNRELLNIPSAQLSFALRDNISRNKIQKAITQALKSKTLSAITIERLYVCAQNIYKIYDMQNDALVGEFRKILIQILGTYQNPFITELLELPDSLLISKLRDSNIRSQIHEISSLILETEKESLQKKLIVIIFNDNDKVSNINTTNASIKVLRSIMPYCNKTNVDISELLNMAHSDLLAALQNLNQNAITDITAAVDEAINQEVHQSKNMKNTILAKNKFVKQCENDDKMMEVKNVIIKLCPPNINQEWSKLCDRELAVIFRDPSLKKKVLDTISKAKNAVKLKLPVDKEKLARLEELEESIALICKNDSSREAMKSFLSYLGSLCAESSDATIKAMGNNIEKFSKPTINLDNNNS